MIDKLTDPINSLSLYNFIIPVISSVVLAVAVWYLAKKSNLWLQKLNKNNTSFFLTKAIEHGILPTKIFLFFYVIILWIKALPANWQPRFDFLFNMSGGTFTKLLIIWWLWRLINSIEEDWRKIKTYKNLKKINIHLDQTSISTLSKLMKGVLIVIIALMIMDQAGFNLSGLLAIGGMGGIIIGLAARDLISNLFGSITLYLERPFRVGDWIASPDKELEGEVLEIGWRRTRIRTLDRRVLLVPNYIFNDISIENYADMTHRAIRQTIGLRYIDSNKIVTVVSAIEEMLKQHPDIDNDQTLLISFEEFGDSSLNLKLIVYTPTTGYVQHFHVKQDIYNKIVAIVQAQGADFAFPTRTVYNLEDDDAKTVKPKSTTKTKKIAPTKTT